MEDLKQKALSFLDQIEVTYEVEDHPAVFTVEESVKFKSKLNGHDTKNLFLRDKKKQNYFLLVVSANKKVDLKELSQIMRVPRFSFGSAEDLNKFLDTTPGSVSFLSIINDKDTKVSLWLDEDVKNSEKFKCHPLINTATVAIAAEDIAKITKATGHQAQVTTVPVV